MAISQVNKMTAKQVAESSNGTMKDGFQVRSSNEFRPRSNWLEGLTFKLTEVAYIEIKADNGQTYYRFGLLTDNGDALYLSMLANTVKRVKVEGKTTDLPLECDLFTIANKYRADLHPEMKGKGELWCAEQILNDCKDKTIVVNRSPYYTAVGNRNGKVEEYETTFPLFNFKKD